MLFKSKYHMLFIAALSASSPLLAANDDAAKKAEALRETQNLVHIQKAFSDEQDLDYFIDQLTTVGIAKEKAEAALKRGGSVTEARNDVYKAIEEGNARKKDALPVVDALNSLSEIRKNPAKAPNIGFLVAVEKNQSINGLNISGIFKEYTNYTPAELDALEMKGLQAKDISAVQKGMEAAKVSADDIKGINTFLTEFKKEQDDANSLIKGSVFSNLPNKVKTMPMWQKVSGAVVIAAVAAGAYKWYTDRQTEKEQKEHDKFSSAAEAA